MARVQEGGFYGWPWYYLGDKEDSALKGKRPDLKSEVREAGPAPFLEPITHTLPL